jgi:hypothetical protein
MINLKLGKKKDFYRMDINCLENTDNKGKVFIEIIFYKFNYQFKLKDEENDYINSVKIFGLNKPFKKIYLKSRPDEPIADTSLTFNDETSALTIEDLKLPLQPIGSNIYKLIIDLNSN